VADVFWGIRLVLQICSRAAQKICITIHHLLEHYFWLLVPYKSVFWAPHLFSSAGDALMSQHMIIN
jgi:hypothetical protein